MSQVKSKNTKPELIIFKLLKDNGLNYKKHYKILGKPDVCFPKNKVLIFINGEFWHGKNFNKEGKSYSDFWYRKIGNNIKRDKRIQKQLRSRGWHILNLWGRDIMKNPEGSISKILRFINKHSQN